MAKHALIRRLRGGGGGEGASGRGDGESWDSDSDTSTIPPMPPEPLVRRAAFVRRAGMLGLLAFVILGLFGMFGTRHDEVRSSGGGYELKVAYSKVTRPGLDTPWEVTVHREEGFKGPLVIRTTAAYFALFDENGLDPEPDAIEQDNQWLTMEFAQPPGKLIQIDFDARISPAIRTGEEAVTQILEGDEPVASVKYRTRVMP